jgi:quercetin dioxygenase-like cupin family protein
VDPIFRVNEHDLPWVDYEESADDHGRAQIRVKGLTYRNTEVPPVQYVEYAAGYTDPVHSHETGEFFIVTEGSLWLDDIENGSGSVVFIPRDTEYAVRAGKDGVRYYRVVVT